MHPKRPIYPPCVLKTLPSSTSLFSPLSLPWEPEGGGLDHWDEEEGGVLVNLKAEVVGGGIDWGGDGRN